MGKTVISRTINAPLDQVFTTVAKISEFEKVIPEIVKVEFISEAQYGVGARFIETRRMNNREASVELEVTEYEENSHVRIISDTHGTIWDTIFTVKDNSGKTELKMVMQSTASNFFVGIMNNLFKKMMEKAIEKDMDRVKEHCES